jgi:hypothetical protein
MDLTVINTIWRPVHGKLVKGLALLTPEWEGLKKLTNFDKLSPRSIIWPVELVNGGGIAYTSDGGSTARAVSNEPVEATDSWKHMTGRFEVSFDIMDAESDGKFAASQIEKQVRYQAMDKLRAFRRAVAVNFYGHNTGHLFLAEGTASAVDVTSTKVRVKDLYGESGLAVPARIRDYVTVNKDYLNVHAGTGSTVRGGGKVIAIDETNNDITIQTAASIDGTVTAGDAIVPFNQILSGSVDDQDLWMNGMLDICRATTLHGISSIAQPDWVPSVNETSYGAAIGGTDLYKWFESLQQRSDYNVEWGYTTVGVIAAGGGTQLDQRRYGSDGMTMKLGFKEVDAMGVMLDGRPYVPAGYLFMGSNAGLRKLSPDEDVRDVVDGGEKAGSFQQYTNRLGFYKDQVFRAQLTCVSRLSLGIV